MAVRTCIGCGRVADQGELARVTLGQAGRLEIGRHTAGRGGWLCSGSVECIDRAARRKAFARALRAPVSAEAITTLRERLVDCATMDGHVNRED